jgi:hypothetical protein
MCWVKIMTVHFQKKYEEWLVYLLSTAKNRTSLSHLQLILEFFLKLENLNFSVLFITLISHTVKI